MQKNSKSFYKHEVRYSYQSRMSHLLPPTVLLCPGPSLKFPGGRGELKKYQCCFFAPSPFPSPPPPLSSSGMPHWADDVPFWISTVDCSLEQWAPDPSITAAPLDLPAGMSQSNFKFTHDKQSIASSPPNLPRFLRCVSFPKPSRGFCHHSPPAARSSWLSVCPNSITHTSVFIPTTLVHLFTSSSWDQLPPRQPAYIQAHSLY